VIEIRWGSIALGAIAGLGITAVLALVLFVLGARPEADSGGIAFIFVQFLGQVAAGYVAGRFAGPHEAFHGSQAGLGLYLVTAALTLATGGEPTIPTILFSAVVALVLGAAGGVLSGHRIRP